MSKNNGFGAKGPVRSLTTTVKFAVMAVASTLMMIVAFAPASAAQEAGPSFVSPVELAPLAGETIIVEVDHAGLDIFSGWIFAGSEPGAGDYAQVHMADNTTAVVSELPRFGQEAVYFTYFYLEVDSTWKTIATTASPHSQPFLVEPEEESFFNCCTLDVQIANPHPFVESSWILVGSSSGASDLGAQHLGTNTTASLQVFPGDGFLIFVTYFWKVAGSWYSFETVILNELLIAT